MKMRLLPCVILSCTLAHFSMALFAKDPVASFDPGRLEATQLLSGLERPMELQVADDGRVFFIELAGSLKVYDPRSQAVRLVGKLEVTTEQENGLIGLALDPDFADNQHLFLQYSPPDFPGQHISRFTLVDGDLDPDSEKLLLRYEEQRDECCHHAGSMQFGPDGSLYIGTGDNTNPFDSDGFGPMDDRKGKEAFDALRTSGNTDSLNGKVLRIRPTVDGGYEIPDGNLFPEGSLGRPEIYVMGCRNPWRISVDQKTGYLYWGDVGPDSRVTNERGSQGYDEVNQARTAGNFGWPLFIGDNQPYAHVNRETDEVGSLFDPKEPINLSRNNTGARQLPPAHPAFLYYPYGHSKEFPALGDGGRTACAGPVYHYFADLQSVTKLPEHFDNTLFIFEWSRNWIKLVHLSDDSEIESIEDFMPDRPFARPIDIEIGPAGSVYILEYGDTWGVNENARLVRVDYVRGNRAPHAVAQVENNVGRHPLDVRLSSASSSDPDHDTLSIAWYRVDASGNETDAARELISTEPNPTVTFQHPGVYTIELVVKDSLGGEARASVPALVGNAAPLVEVRQPKGGFFEPGKPVRFEIFVNDLEDGTNDIDLADEQDLPEIDGESAARASMNARKISGRFALDLDLESMGPPGLRLMKASDCFNCHDLHQKRVGPAYMEVARKYRDQPNALQKSIERVLNGSTGVWGKVAMIPHRQHSLGEVRQMVEWVYSLRDEGGLDVVRGFVGDVVSDPEYSGGLQLDASYTDLGADGIPPITSTATVRIRSRLVEAEHANHMDGPSEFETEEASGNKLIGGINHGHSLRFDDIDLESVGKITVRAGSDGDGGDVEIRLGSPDGRLIGQVHVAPTGGWVDWKEHQIDIRQVDGTHDLFIVFRNDQSETSLMAIDSFFFHPNE